MMTPKSRKMIRKKEVLRRVPIGYDTILRLTKKGQFPQSVNIPGSRLVFWFEDEIDKWQEAQPRGVSDFKPPVRRVILDND
jgi:predicted DNA-binding transcriptional regulator AlpA